MLDCYTLYDNDLDALLIDEHKSTSASSLRSLCLYDHLIDCSAGSRVPLSVDERGVHIHRLRANIGLGWETQSQAQPPGANKP